MPVFHVTVKRVASAQPFQQRVKSQNAVYAAACGLSLAGGGSAEVIEVCALMPAPGRPASTRFTQCRQEVYGFCFGSRSAYSA